MGQDLQGHKCFRVLKNRFASGINGMDKRREAAQTKCLDYYRGRIPIIYSLGIFIIFFLFDMTMQLKIIKGCVVFLEKDMARECEGMG